METANLSAGVVMPGSNADTGTGRLRLEFLDGIRGLAALYVVLGHARDMGIYVSQAPYATLIEAKDGFPRALSVLLRLCQYDRYSVVVFIVLSGYCLMLPVARSKNGLLKGGAGEYLKRRARRILPPYYVALGLSLLLTASVPGLRHLSNSVWNIALPAFTGPVVVSHLLMIQNLSLGWLWKIDPPMWSVATEWQIYFVFPLLLLPVWRRGGTAAMAAVGLAVGMGLHFLLHQRIDQAAPWFVGAFALGVAGASVNFSARAGEASLRTRAPWGVLSVLSVAVLAVLIRHPQVTETRPWLLDVVAAAGAMCLLIWCTRHAAGEMAGGTPSLLRLFQSRWAVMLGTFSYSLYLVHYPVMGALNAVLRALPMTPTARLEWMFGAGVPVSILLAYGFHLAFERRFMPNYPRTERQVIAATLREPAI